MSTTTFKAKLLTVRKILHLRMTSFEDFIHNSGTPASSSVFGSGGRVEDAAHHSASISPAGPSVCNSSDAAPFHALDSQIMIAKKRVWGSIYRPIWKVFPPVPKVVKCKPFPQPTGLCFLPPDELGDDGGSEPLDSKVQSIRVFRNKRSASELSWDGLLNTQRIAAIRKWVGIISTSPLSFDLGRRWNRLDPLGASLAEGLKNVFADRATGALHSRAGAPLRLVAWCHKNGHVPFPLREESVYQFMMNSEGTAPTFLRSLLVSLRFAHHILGLTGADDVVSSQRVIGCAKLAYLKKRRLVQKDPLSVAMVVAMEAFADLEKPSRGRFVIGCFLICTFMRARFSDMMNLVDFTDDDFDHHGLLGGFVEAKVTRTKSAYTLERKTMYLPMTAPRCCLTGLDWFRGWQHAGMMDSVPRGESVPVFPALTNQGWSKAPMTAGAAADWMRKILLHWGFPRERVDRLGTHSCKTTTLSWLSKFGESLEIRSQLGYHQTQGSALIYSRDAMAGPIRRLQFVLEQIRGGRKFLPDQSRSGYFVDGGPVVRDGLPSVADTETEDEI